LRHGDQSTAVYCYVTGTGPDEYVGRRYATLSGRIAGMSMSANITIEDHITAGAQGYNRFGILARWDIVDCGVASDQNIAVCSQITGGVDVYFGVTQSVCDGQAPSGDVTSIAGSHSDLAGIRRSVTRPKVANISTL
jgi:hypothetical protein